LITQVVTVDDIFENNDLRNSTHNFLEHLNIEIVLEISAFVLTIAHFKTMESIKTIIRGLTK